MLGIPFSVKFFFLKNRYRKINATLYTTNELKAEYKILIYMDAFPIEQVRLYLFRSWRGKESDILS